MTRTLLIALLIFASTLAVAQTPTPVKTVPKPAYDPNAPKPSVVYQRHPARAATGGWQRFKGATQCTQTPDGVLSCDNGYTQRVR
jgi:hypothetical protein